MKRPKSGKKRRSGSRSSVAEQSSAGGKRSRDGNNNRAMNIVAAVDLAEKYLATDRGAQVVELLERFAPEVNSSIPDVQKRYFGSLAQGLALSGKLTESETAAGRLINLDPDTCAGWYVLVFVQLGLREFAKAEESGLRYLASPQRDQDCSHAKCTLPGQQSQLLNMLGTALREMGRTADAEKRFHDAIGLDPGNHLPYLNLANVYRK